MKTRSRNRLCGIECLEPRLAPAGFMTYTDIDGDRVRLARTDPGPFPDEGVSIVNGQLVMLDLMFPMYQGASFTFTVTKGPLGDGLANVGRIRSAFDLGTVIVKGDLGAIEAGDNNTTTPAIKMLSVRSMGRYGIATQYAPLGPDLVSEIYGPFGALKVTGDIKDAFINVIGGSAGTIGSVTVGGSLVGGSGDFTGCIFSDGDMGPVKIGGDVVGGAGVSGAIRSDGKLAALTIGGSLVGGAGESGSIFSDGDMGPVKIGGNVVGGGNGITPAGRIFTLSNLGGVTVGSSLLGGSGSSSGGIISGGAMGPVRIGRDMVGGAGLESGSIRSGGQMGGVTIGGSLLGGPGESSGSLSSVNDMGPVKIARDVAGGAGDNTGKIHSFRKLGAVTLGGSLVGGSGNDSSEIFSQLDMGPVKIGGNLRGGSITGSDSLSGSGLIRGGRIAGVAISGSIFSGIDDSTGTLTDSGSIRAINDIGPIVVRGSIVGHSTPNGDTPVIISARGQVNPTATIDLAIQSLTVGGHVESTLILLGYGTNSVGQNADAQVGAVKVGGDWVASSLVVGAGSGTDGFFGTADDTKLPAGVDLGAGPVHDAGPVSRIASVTIGGLVIGSAAAGDHFGFIAEQIGSFKSLGFTAPLSNVIELSPITDDVTIRRIV